MTNPNVQFGRSIKPITAADVSQNSTIILYSRLSESAWSANITVGSQPVVIKAFGLGVDEEITIYNVFNNTREKMYFNGDEFVLNMGNNTQILAISGVYVLYTAATLGNITCIAYPFSAMADKAKHSVAITNPAGPQSEKPNTFYDGANGREYSQDFYVGEYPLVFRAYGLTTQVIELHNLFEAQSEQVFENSVAVQLDATHSTLIISVAGRYGFRLIGDSTGVTVTVNPTVLNYNDPFLKKGDVGPPGGVTSVNSRVGVVTLTKADVSLSNVDNTSDANKPVSTAQAAADSLHVLLTSVGAASGVAPLDAGSKVPSVYLPSYVDDVIEVANYAALPGTGETGKIYITLDTNAQYRWSGSAYIVLTASPGTTDAVPEGATNKYFTTARVLATALAGLSLASSADITSADSVLSAFGKLQAQITAGGSSAWGAITGTLSAQTDLQSALDLKAPILNPVFDGLLSRVNTTLSAYGSPETEFVKFEQRRDIGLGGGYYYYNRFRITDHNNFGLSVGTSYSPQYDSSQSGYNHVAFGNTITQSGYYNFAHAWVTTQSGSYSTAHGGHHTQSGNYGFATGDHLNDGGFNNTFMVGKSKTAACNQRAYFWLDNGIAIKPVAGDAASPENGVIAYNSTTSKFRVYQGGAWTDMVSSGGAWGAITGTLSAQTDLQSALDLKAPKADPVFTGLVSRVFTGSPAPNANTPYVDMYSEYTQAGHTWRSEYKQTDGTNISNTLRRTDDATTNSTQSGYYNIQIGKALTQSGDKNFQHGTYSSQSGVYCSQRGSYNIQSGGYTNTQSGYQSTQSGVYSFSTGHDLNDGGFNFTFMVGGNKTATADSRAYFALDNGIWIKPVAGDAASPENGVICYNSTSSKFRGYAAGAWQTFGSGDGTVTSVTATAPVTSTGGATPVIAINAATTSLPGSLSAADKAKLDAITGTNTGDQTITLTGDVTGSGTGSFAATIANSAVTLAKQANMATASVVYRKTAGAGVPEVQTLATLKTDLGLTGTNTGDQDLSYLLASATRTYLGVN